MMTSLAIRYRIHLLILARSRSCSSWIPADTPPDSLSNPSPAPTSIKASHLTTPPLPPPTMPISPYFRPPRPDKDLLFVDYDLLSHPDSDQMIFGPLELDDHALLSPTWDPAHDIPYNQPISPILSDNPASPYHASDYDISDASPSTHSFGGFDDVHPILDLDDSNLSHWLTDSHLDPSSSSPIPIRSTQSDPHSPSAFISYGSHFSPSGFAALHPLPRSLSPAEISDGYLSSPGLGVVSISPAETSLRPPAWASQLWDSSHYAPATRSSGLHPPLSQNPYTAKGRFHPRRDANPLGLSFQSSSAPSPNAATLTRAYSRRADSASVSDDRDATVRRRRKMPPDDPVKSAESRTCISDHIRSFCELSLC